MENGKNSANEVISAQQAEVLKMKEKRLNECEKNLPRNKRRRLEAAQERLEDEEEADKDQQGSGNGKGKEGKLLVDLAYRRAKAAKAMTKAQVAGKIVKRAGKTSKHRPQRTQSRTEEMRELFQFDMGERKQKRSTHAAGKKKSKHSFKSKSRYKRK